jgi:hypothetical protein
MSSQDENIALLAGSSRGASDHIVRTETFDNSGKTFNPDGSKYDGYTANIGRAETLCGLEKAGRLSPIDDEPEGVICGNCKRVIDL